MPNQCDSEACNHERNAYAAPALHGPVRYVGWSKLGETARTDPVTLQINGAGRTTFGTYPDTSGRKGHWITSTNPRRITIAAIHYFIQEVHTQWLSLYLPAPVRRPVGDLRRLFFRPVQCGSNRRPRGKHYRLPGRQRLRDRVHQLPLRLGADRRNGAILIRRNIINERNQRPALQLLL